MEEFQKRVVDEYNELFEKTKKLGLFFGTKTFNDLKKDEQFRLDKQWQIMQQYGLILSERISAFNK